MHAVASIAALAAALPTALGAYQGFNYGATYSDGTVRTQSDFESDFTTAAGLDGTDGAFTSARLYTMIQGDTTSDTISAIPAAISTKTTLLLGIWCSAGDTVFANELTALQSAITTYGSELASIVAGISVGSEDLYRISVTGMKTSDGNPGVGPSVLVDYIKQVRELISGTVLADVAIGHVDTWNDWTNSSNSAVIDNVDWLGVDAYPYYQTSDGNDISNGKALLDAALSETVGVAGGRDVWITETGWPVSGDASGDAVASLANAKTYWDDAGCPLFGNTNVWWYTLQDSAPTTPNPSFGVVGSTLSTTPLYDLSCSNVTSSSSASSSVATSTSASSASGKATSATAIAAGSSGTDSSSSSASSSSSSSGSGSSNGSGSSSSSGSKAGNSTASSGVPAYTGSSGVGYNSTMTYKASAGSSATSKAAAGAGAASTLTAVASAAGGSSTTGSSSTSTSVVVSGSNVVSGSIGAAFAAILVAMLAL